MSIHECFDHRAFIFRYLFSLAYLHEGLEPKVVHRDVKSSNILIDRQWNSKVSDFGLAKLLCSENSYVTTRVMGTFGLVIIKIKLSNFLVVCVLFAMCTFNQYYSRVFGRSKDRDSRIHLVVFVVMLHQNTHAPEC